MQQTKHPKNKVLLQLPPPALTSPDPYDSIMIPDTFPGIEGFFLCCWKAVAIGLNSAISRALSQGRGRCRLGCVSGTCIFLSQFGSGGLNIVWNLHQLHDSQKRCMIPMGPIGKKHGNPNLWDIKTDQPSDCHSWLVDENLCDMWFS